MSNRRPPKKIDLNLPFEVQEVLLSPAEKAKLAKGPVINQLFGGEPARIEIQEFALRPISVRLRTMNNACDSGASLPNGIQLTAVSMYGGGRDRQYVLGPYDAVKQLMAGWVPDHTPRRVFSAAAQKDQQELANAIEHIQLLLGGPEGGRSSSHLLGRIYLPCLIRSRAAPDRVDRSVELRSQDADFLRGAMAQLEALQLQLPKPPEPTKPPEHWWEEMADPPGLEGYERSTSEVLSRAREVLHQLEDRVFASA